MTEPCFLTVVATGRVEEFEDHHGHALRTAIRNRPHDGPVDVTAEGLVGNETVSAAHGGPDMRVHVFAASNYPWFDERAGRTLPRPAFGENLIVTGYDETTGRVGDVIRAGTAVFRVTQPTQRCAKIGRSLGIDDMVPWFTDSGRTGWYLAVEEPGSVRAGDSLEVIEQGPAEWTLARLNRLIAGQETDPDVIRAAADCDALGQAFAKNLRKLLD